MSLKWKIYYDDGSTYSDELGDPFEAPARGVQIIAIEHPEVGRELLGKEDFYWYRDGRWFGGDNFGMYDYLLFPGPKKVIFGRVISSVEFQKIIKRCNVDDYLPLKSGRLQGERI